MTAAEPAADKETATPSPVESQPPQQEEAKTPEVEIEPSTMVTPEASGLTTPQETAAPEVTKESILEKIEQKIVKVLHELRCPNGHLISTHEDKSLADRVTEHCATCDTRVGPSNAVWTQKEVEVPAVTEQAAQ